MVVDKSASQGRRKGNPAVKAVIPTGDREIFFPVCSRDVTLTVNYHFTREPRQVGLEDRWRGSGNPKLRQELEISDGSLRDYLPPINCHCLTPFPLV